MNQNMADDLSGQCVVTPFHRMRVLSQRNNHVGNGDVFLGRVSCYSRALWLYLTRNLTALSVIDVKSFSGVMRKDKLSNPASLRGHPNATLYKGIEISSKCSWLYLLYEKEKYILKGYVSCNHAGFIKCRKMSPNNTQEDYNCQSEQRSCSCLFASLPCCSDFSGHGSTEQGEECEESYLTIKRQCQPSTELNFGSSVPIMKFSKGEICTTGGVETILCGPINGTLSF